ncbi:MAG: diguanylate cyclase [Treponema sp.]|nr:MAG: diguanylate cyclase [Treponema sp.]
MEEKQKGSESKIELLSKTGLFSGWNNDELGEVLQFSENRKIDEGETIYASDTKPEGFYLILSGSVGVYSSVEETILAEFITGDIFGDFEFMTGKNRTATAKAEKSCEILVFPKKGQTLDGILNENPELYAKFLKAFLLVIAGRTRAATGLLKENSPVTRELKKQLYSDKLTGVYNKTYLEENLQKLLIEPTSLIMMKPDNFKDINDTFGHEIGDETLVFLSKLATHSLSSKSTLVRYAGNEFAVITPGQNRDEAYEFAKKIQEFIHKTDISPVTNDPNFFVKLSLGIAMYPEHSENANELIELCVNLPLVGRKRGGKCILFAEDAE